MSTEKVCPTVELQIAFINWLRTKYSPNELTVLHQAVLEWESDYETESFVDVMFEAARTMDESDPSRTVTMVPFDEAM